MKLLSALAIFVTALMGQPTITSDTTPPVVAQGTTHTFAATCTGGCTWGLTTGSAGSINSSTGVYTAPAKVTVNQSVDGCQLLTPDSPYNARIDGLPTIAQSSNWTTLLVNGGRGLNLGAGGLPYTIVNSSTPTQNFMFAYTGSLNGAYQVPALYDVQGGYYMRAGDRHYFTIRPDTCNIVEIYNSGGNGTGWDIFPKSSSVVKYPSITGALLGGTNAAGEYFLPASLKIQEVAKALATGSNVIPHMINVTLHNYTQLCNNGTAGPYQWPATGNAGIVCSGGDIPYGARMRLKSSYVYGGTNPITQILINTMQQFGFDVSDGGYSMDSYGADGDTLIPQLRAALLEIGTLFPAANLSNFEFVDMTTLAPATTTDAQGGLIDITKATTAGYTIAQFAEVTVTDTVGTTKMRVLLQGGTVDFESSVFGFQAGAGAYNLPYHISGFATTGVTCTMSPSVGTLNSSTCQYAPPATLASPTSTVVTLASVDDPTVKTECWVLVFPSGDLRLLMNNPSDFVDHLGNTWYTVYPTGNFPLTNSGYGANGNVYQDAQTSYVDYQLYGYSPHPRADYGVTLHVAPGNYRLTLNGISQTGSGAIPAGMVFTVNGQNAYFGRADTLAATTGVPQSFVVPVVVDSSGLLTISTRHNDFMNTPGADLGAATLGSILLQSITCPGASTSPLPGSGVWWPYGVSGSSVTTIDPCAAAPSLGQHPWSMLLPSPANK